jgi:hypothetical protein
MKDPFELIYWALGIGLAWMILISLTGLDDWLKGIFGKGKKQKELRTQLQALEARVALLEKK